MALLDDINRLLRDHTGYTGDGQGSNGPLPVGDRSTARYTPNMRDLRELMKTIAQTLGDPGALQDILANSGKVFANRADAVSAGQSVLTGVLGRIATIEADHLVYRAPYQNGDDPLFDSAPYWGATDRFPRQSFVDYLDGLRSAAIRSSGALRLTNIGGTGDAITADLHPVMVDAGITDLSTSSEVEFVPVATNTAVNPSFTVAGVTYQIRNSDGGTWPANGFVVGRSYTLRRRNNVLRVASGDVTATELAKLVDRAGIQKLENVGGTENAISAAMPSGGFPATGVRVLLTPLVANTGDVTLSIDGGPAVQVRGMDGQQVPPGGLRPAQPILIERMSSPSVWRIVMDNLSKSYVDGLIQETQTDLRADVALVADQTVAIAAEIAAPFISVQGDDFIVMESDASSNALRVMRPDGQDMIMSQTFWERGADALGIGGGGSAGLSDDAIQIVSENGQSLSVGGAYVPEMNYEIAMASALPGAALMLSGLQHSDGGEVRIDGPRSRSYNMTVHASGVRQAEPHPGIITGAFPLSSMLNLHRQDHGLAMVPILTTCHGIAGVAIEDMDDDPLTGSGSTLIWDNMSFWYDEAKAVAAAAGKTLSVPYHDWLHGTSASTAPAGQYLSRLWDYQRDFRALLAAKEIGGAAIMVMGQPAGASNTSNPAVAWHCRDEVLQFCEQGGGILATAEHWYEISDNNVHPDALSTALMQETRAWAIASVEAGQRWTIHRPVVSTDEGVMTLDFATLHEDEYLVADVSKYNGEGIDQHFGFELIGGEIVASELRGRQVFLTYTGTPAQVRYAYQEQDARVFDDNRYVAPRGVLRTSKTKRSKMAPGHILVRAIPAFRINL
ncbi:hypothetical protein [Paracoccus thiocyanatus]|uniref:Uncharacterized protein n=1 Tax=Paracoccus thiocyanatus TaxID=34006 RepID=A0A3D8PGV5_9RHOB|nr:hypothetical protein [Paracoccus thiocyanatus]RDW14439.1 hypothetical protein DIE28_02740 [Paracoccus thiocyanatus]